MILHSFTTPDYMSVNFSVLKPEVNRFLPKNKTSYIITVHAKVKIALSVNPFSAGLPYTLITLSQAAWLQHSHASLPGTL